MFQTLDVSLRIIIYNHTEMKSASEVFEKAYEAYLSSGLSVRKISKQFGINHNTFYLFLKKNKKAESKRSYGGRKKTYSDELLESAFSDINNGIELSLVASKYGISKSTLRNYYSLYKTQNEEVKSVNKTIARLKNKGKTATHSPALEFSRSETSRNPEMIPDNYKKISNTEIKVTYKSSYSELQEEFSEVDIYFKRENNNGVLINLSFLVLIFGKREGVVKEIYNALSNERKITDNSQLYANPYKEWLQKDYFPITMFLETLRQIKSKLDIIEELKNIYLFIKQEKSNIEKILL